MSERELLALESIECRLGVIEAQNRAIYAQNRIIMSAISDFAAKVNANFAQIQAGITSLDSQIQAFQNSPGTLSAADQASLDAIVASSSALATAANASITPPVPPTT